MSAGITLETHTETTVFGDVVVFSFGVQPINWMGKAAEVAGADAVFDSDAARITGANIVVGNPAAISKLRALLDRGALLDAQAANPGMSPEAVQWLTLGERGSSSNTIFQRLTGMKVTTQAERTDHPYDFGDFRRCRLLLEAVPALVPLLPQMAEVSTSWKHLIGCWDDICLAMDEEAPDWRHGWNRCNSPTARDLIRKAIGLGQPT